MFLNCSNSKVVEDHSNSLREDALVIIVEKMLV